MLLGLPLDGTHVARWESGDTKCPMKTLRKVAYLLRYDPLRLQREMAEWWVFCPNSGDRRVASAARRVMRHTNPISQRCDEVGISLKRAFEEAEGISKRDFFRMVHDPNSQPPADPWPVLERVLDLPAQRIEQQWRRWSATYHDLAPEDVLTTAILEENDDD